MKWLAIIGGVVVLLVVVCCVGFIGLSAVGGNFAANITPVAAVPTRALAVPPAAAQESRPSEIDEALPIPANAVLIKQEVRRVEYTIPQTPPAVLAFFQSALPSTGWKIDAKTSDPAGVKPGTGGTRTLNVCRGQKWLNILWAAEGAGSKMIILYDPKDLDPC